MTATNFKTTNESFRKLLGSGLTYHIPRFQRDYSWSEEEWEDLWQDVLGTMTSEGEPAHYMGYLVLQSFDDKTFAVIDGQQRLTTLSLIVLAGMRHLHKLIQENKEPDGNKKRLDQLRTDYIGFLDPVTLLTRSKLTLNRNNDEYYQRYLVALESHLPQRGFPASVHLMRKAFEWMERHLREHLKGVDDPGRAVAEFIGEMSDKLFFTVITVADDLNAYKVFETLNARGVRLSATDLLKNYLFSVLAKDARSSPELDELEKRWESMVGRLGSESLPDFLRMHWNSRETFARQADLFKIIRGRIRTREQAFALLRAMDQDVDTYLALTQPEGSQWSPQLRDRARDLRLFAVRQPFPMLMAAKRVLSDDDFERLLHATVVVSFRYNVIGAQNPNDQERVYHAVAREIAAGTLPTSDEIISSLRPIYPSDDSFRASFADKVIKTTANRNNKVVRYILCKLERQVGGQEFDFESPSFSVEHILPQSPGAGWEAFRDADLESFTFRIGNMTMLETSKNRELANSSFKEKALEFARSAFLLTQSISRENQEWTPERISARQKALARQATSIWRVNKL